MRKKRWRAGRRVAGTICIIFSVSRDLHKRIRIEGSNNSRSRFRPHYGRAGRSRKSSALYKWKASPSTNQRRTNRVIILPLFLLLPVGYMPGPTNNITQRDRVIGLPPPAHHFSSSTFPESVSQPVPSHFSFCLLIMLYRSSSAAAGEERWCFILRMTMRVLRRVAVVLVDDDDGLPSKSN